MSTPSRSDARHVRLNPFAFPADTDLRFVLLIVMIVAASLFAFNWIYLRLSADEMVRLWEACPEEQRQATQVPVTCFKPHQQAGSLMAIGGVLVMGALAIGLYWHMPARKIRRDRLVQLSREDVPEVVDELAVLVAESGLKMAPVFVWSPLNMTVTGQAFGHTRQKYVMLSGGLVAEYYANAATFRAIVRHELAHLRNGDVDKTYLVVASWIAFVVVAVVPFALVLLEQFSRGQRTLSVLGQALVFGVLALLVFATRNTVLQAREVYADVRASIVDGPHGALLEVVSDLPRSQGGWFRRTLATHPSTEERVSAIESPDRLFQIRLFDVFLTGVAGSIAFWNVMTVATGLLPLQAEVLAGMFASLAFAPLIAGVIGIGIWRSVVVANWRGQICSGLFPIAFVLAVGLFVGRVLSPISALLITQPLAFADRLAETAFESLIQVWMLIGLLVFIRWIVDSATSWSTLGTTQLQASRQTAAMLVVVAMVLTLWYGLLQTLLNAAQTASTAGYVLLMTMFGRFTESPFVAIFQEHGRFVGLALFATMWLLPVLPLLVLRDQRQTYGKWFALDADGVLEDPEAIKNSSLRSQWKLTVALALGASVVFGLMHLLTRLLARAVLPESVRGSGEFLLAFASLTYTLGALVQCGLAIIVALVVKRLGVTHALVAVSVMSLTMGVILVLINLAYGGTVSFESARDIFFTTATLGMWLVLPVATLVATLAERVRFKQHTMSLVRSAAS